MKSVFKIVLMVLLFTLPAYAQKWEFFPGGTYDSKITTPDTFLGYQLGARFTYQYQMLEYFKKLASETSRVHLYQYGKTYELRPLNYLVITSPDNFARIDEIRQNNLKLADPRKLSNPEEAKTIAKSNPVFVWLGYNVHGNESCSSEAAILTVYQLAAGTDQFTQDVLKNVVVLVEPMLNPDGRDGYAVRYNAELDKIPNSSRLSAERSAGGGGRTNHYGVDLNRDWAFLTQDETKSRTVLYRQWMPQAAVDFHEMGSESSYFFFPAATPVNANFPKQVIEWQKVYGKGNARAFDYFGWQYYTGEGFDLYYPGYGDSWPTMMGATGMTFEQGGGGGAGVTMKRTNDYLTLRDRLWHHFTTSMAVIRTSLENREKRLLGFYDYFASALEEGKSGDIKAYILPPPANPVTFNIMLETLMNQGIEVEKAVESFKVSDIRGYFAAGDSVKDKSPSTRGGQEKEFSAGTYLIKMAQPNKRLIKILFEPNPALPDTFFYDVSVWAFPYASNVETYWTGASLSVKTSPVKAVQPLSGKVTNAPAQYAYLMPLKGVETTLAYYELARNDVQGGIANRPFTIEGQEYPRGTAVFHVGTNKQKTDFQTLINQTAEKFGVNIVGVNTGIVEKGIDLGSGRIAKLVKPKIGVIGGDGSIRHMFDYRYNIDYTNIEVAQVGNLDIDEINVVIVSSNLSQQLTTDVQINKLKDWIRAGGVYVGWGGGASFALGEKVQLANFKLSVRPERDKEEQKRIEEKEKRLTVEEREFYRKAQASPGYFAKALLDITHPLAYGMKREIAVLKFGTTAFELPTTGGVVGVFDKNPLLGGYVTPENLKQIADKGYVVYASFGSGHVILFSDNPTWREFLTGLEPLFLNAVLLMPSQ